MTPINSIYDVRLVTLFGTLINAIESLAIETDRDPDVLLAESLFLVNKRLHEVGEEMYLEKLKRHYPILQEAIK